MSFSENVSIITRTHTHAMMLMICNYPRYTKPIMNVCFQTQSDAKKGKTLKTFCNRLKMLDLVSLPAAQNLQFLWQIINSLCRGSFSRENSRINYSLGLCDRIEVMQKVEQHKEDTFLCKRYGME